jgi:hypothetical protein
MLGMVASSSDLEPLGVEDEKQLVKAAVKTLQV